MIVAIKMGHRTTVRFTAGPSYELVAALNNGYCCLCLDCSTSVNFPLFISNKTDILISLLTTLLITIAQLITATPSVSISKSQAEETV